MAATSISAARRWRPGAIALWAAFAVMFLLIAMTANRGLEMSDEAYYIFSITNPGIFKANIHPFGAVFHLVWQAVGHSIVLLRLFGLLLITASSATLGFYLERYYLRVCGRRLSFDPVPATAFLGLVFYADISIMTPSYNLLANSAACLIVAGVLGWRTQDARAEATPTGTVPSLLVGFGGCLALFAKPPFAAFAAGAVAVMLARDAWNGANREVLRRLAIAALACLLPIALIALASVDVPSFVESLAEGLRATRSDKTSASLPLKTLAEVLGMPKPTFATGLVLAAICAWRAKGAKPRLKTAMRTAAWAVLLYDLGFFLLHVGLIFAYGNPIWILMAMPSFTVILGLMTVGLAYSGPAALPSRDLWSVAVLLFLPFAIAFGTSNHILVQIAESMFAYLLAGAILADLLLPRLAAASVQALLIAYAVALLLWTAHLPYRLPTPIWEQSEPIVFGKGHDRLYVDGKTRLFVQSLRDVAAREVLTLDTPIVDLTGNGPGAALLLNGNAPYAPWIGRGSGSLANAAWRSLGAQEQREAWIILPADPSLAQSEPMKAFLQNRRRYRLAARAPNMDYQGGPPLEIWVPDEQPRR